MSRGVFITFEGGDGTGKSTQIKLFLDFLRNNNVEFIFTREPGGTAIGERVRQILLDPSCGEMEDMTEVMLYAAARAQLAREVIIPALGAGKVVVCDRWVDSSIVYQGLAKDLMKSPGFVGEDLSAGLDESLSGAEYDMAESYEAEHYSAESHEAAVTAVNEYATGGLEPDVTILLDLDPKKALGRAGGKSGSLDRIESKGNEYHRAVRESYLALAECEARIRIVNAAGTPKAVHERVLEVVRPVVGIGR